MTDRATTLSIVIPALNERENLPELLALVPHQELIAHGWSTEVIVVDNGSDDGTAELAAELGATVVHEPRRGYGNAYRSGLDAATGEVIATGDADLTYPFDALPGLLATLEATGADFLNTDRLHRDNLGAMSLSHAFGNLVLSGVSRALFGSRYHDSQSGMWVFRRTVWAGTDVRSPGMAFSQEIKNEAWRRGFVCAEVPIEYRPRGGDMKLNPVRDGLTNLAALVQHRVRRPVQVAPVGPVGAVGPLEAEQPVVLEPATQVIAVPSVEHVLAHEGASAASGDERAAGGDLT